MQVGPHSLYSSATFITAACGLGIVNPCYDRCPSDEQKRYFIRRYLHYFHETEKKSDEEIGAEAEKMLSQIPLFEAVSGC